MRYAMLAATEMNFGERAAYAGRMLLIGMATVFSSLIILWGVLVLFRLIVERMSARHTPQAQPKAPAAAETDAATATGSDGELVAAITAAIAATLAEENGGQVPAFRVVSFHKLKSAKRG